MVDGHDLSVTEDNFQYSIQLRAGQKFDTWLRNRYSIYIGFYYVSMFTGSAKGRVLFGSLFEDEA